MKNGFRNAKVGDKVWDIMDGWGKIIEIRKDFGAYPIKVSDFENESLRTETYTWDGKSFKNHINPTLFWDKINIKPPSKPEVQLEKDELKILLKEMEILLKEIRNSFNK